MQTNVFDYNHNPAKVIPTILKVVYNNVSN